jgi:hypothetical protein
MPRTGWTPMIVPYGADQTVYLVIDRFARLGSVYRETEAERADLETIITDLMSGHFNGPVAISMASPSPSIATVDALRDGRRWLGRAAEALNLFRPEQAFSIVRLTRGFLDFLARMFRVNPGTSYPVTENSPSGWAAHRGITAALAAAGNATRF